MRWSRRARQALTVSLVMLAVCAGLLVSPPAPGSAALSFVGRQGTQLVRDGIPLRLLGVNFYSAAGDPAIYQCGPAKTDPDQQLSEYVRRIRAETGSTVIRFWAFQSYTNGGTDWRALDRVVRIAREQNVLLMPVLENQWADCTFDGPRDAEWYASGYRQPSGRYPLSYEEYVRRVVTRYRDEPAIVAWMLMNEAEAKRSDGTSDPESLYRFFEHMTGRVREIDPNHLISLGLIGGGQPGTAYPHVHRLHALPLVDLVTYHDYRADHVPLPGARLEVTGFSQDQQYVWSNGPYQPTHGQRWETVTYQVPQTNAPDAPGSQQALHRSGLTMFGDFSGDLFIDEIIVGDRTYDFEDGTTQGWVTEGPGIVEASTHRAQAGTWSLRVTVTRPERGVHVWLAAPADVRAGSTITARVFGETPGIRPFPNTLAAAVVSASTLDKPLLVTEAGMATCDLPPGVTSHTPESRADLLNAKIDALFGVGGAGYLVWAWNPMSSCSYAFSSGDPVNPMLRQWASRVAGP